ncbi:hypothetical protein QBC34DRAFT_401216 [Podospora aff. communis PSN243]|uniref:Uncharacterized protein n=1 Tax=Podospora aff. communis PSN243 TaxID=3040156 RepID=A0AAV9GY84_9PEZI|nr:hypothetical protein QBC34DRAFT_401216 [Podospora aff. communis PSN243]
MSLQPHIALLVAEQCSDLKTVLHLMQTCRQMHRLLSTYERSMVKEIASLREDAFKTTPSGSILTSFDQERLLIEPISFEYIQELDMRSRRVAALFSAQSLLYRTLETDRAFRSLPPKQMAKLIAGLQRAATITDRLADTLADIMTTNETLPGAPDQTNAIVRQTHRSQLEYITNELSPLELAYLGTLADIAANAYSSVHPYGDGDPSPWPRIAAFKEALLRQGTLVLWAWMAPTSPPTASSDSDNTVSTDRQTTVPPTPAVQKRLVTYVEDVVHAVLDEIEVYESGKGASAADDFDNETLILPGLYRTVKEAFSNKTGWAFDRAPVEMEMMVLWDIRHGEGLGGIEKGEGEKK